jgi:nicotinate-nucleotide adenylyltransferase
MFNPPHLGHLALARAAADELGLERVLLTPALIPPHKPAEWDPGARHRLNMCRLAAGAGTRVGVCTHELERSGPSYTVDTLRAIHDGHPGIELTLILGADIARTLPAWREPGEILKLARLAVAERDGCTRRQVLDALAPLGGGGRTVFLRMARCDASSSLVRTRLAQGRPVDRLVGEEVARYIARHELYRSRAGSSARRVARR